MSDVTAKQHQDSGDDSPNVPKKSFVADVDALSEDLAQFATGTAVTDAARASAHSKPDQLDLLSDFQPNTADSSPPLKPASEPFSSVNHPPSPKPAAAGFSTSQVEDLLGDTSSSAPATAPPQPPPSAPAPEKVAPVAATAPDLEPREEKPPKPTAPELPVADVKPTIPPASKPKAAEMPSEPTSTTGSSKKASCCVFSPGAIWGPACLHPCVEELVYWRQPKKSGLVFGVVLAVLLSLTCFSLISVVAYLALFTLAVAICFRVYRNVLQAVQKSSEGHPFKEYLEKDLTLPKERVHETVDTVVKHVDQLVVRLRSLFLVEDLVDSLKLALLFWVLTYVGSWFNGMTLIILAYVAAFTLPKVYETYKTEIDQYVGLARTHVGNVIGTIKSKIPIGQQQQAQRPKEE
uniref:Reticulon-like protein n=1 Tax=Amblyomma cajennense TaxID=34607 RepID=A0A023FIV7_AMBCJ